MRLATTLSFTVEGVCLKCTLSSYKALGRRCAKEKTFYIIQAHMLILLQLKEAILFKGKRQMSHLQTERAVKDGYDVRGYMYWTLIDNFEWNFAWLLKFGVYAWDENQEPSYRKFRESAAVRLCPCPCSCFASPPACSCMAALGRHLAAAADAV